MNSFAIYDKMKPITQIAILFCSLTCFGQANKTVIKLSTGDCRSNKPYSWPGIDTVTFYMLPEGTLAYRIIPEQYRKWPAKIEDVIAGNYRLTYKNYFGQVVTEQITIEEQTTNSVVLCPDKLLQYPQNTLTKLEDRDTISITFRSQGCFHSYALKLLITKENDRLIAQLYTIVWYQVKKKRKALVQYQEGTLLKSVTMTYQNIQDFTRFENELNYARDAFCTTTNWYDVQSKYLNVKKTDGTCRWDGFHFLQRSLFGKIE